MLPAFLVRESVVEQEGTGHALELGPSQGKPLLLTLGITRIVEQESLDVSVWGSAGGEQWAAKPLRSFPQKFYCGTYQMELDLTGHPEITHVRAQWRVCRWGRGSSSPLFEFFLFAQESARVLRAKSA
ncbi:MAG TPA: hypothetical protein VLH09_05790 [Bryobacteraceae bacterium]|nr:hypothetical protein [Bryobacteraceae bacterium]